MLRRSRVLAVVVFMMIMLPVFAAAVRGDESMSRGDGKLLYQQNCSGCHGDLEATAKGGRSMNRVRTAIRTLHQHKDFAAMPDEHIVLIVRVLKDVKD